eukprot:TRINITY_DN3337_c1_g2_i1.p1 TRINITY_DN3337_c1_g2~~TRINITY_DN3337_c1_g2_i1.p1  ORF type:complete len:300 (+),score=49.94 TRINITY_DN3337_c1_g2_i1:137-1036(+)
MFTTQFLFFVVLNAFVAAQEPQAPFPETYEGSVCEEFSEDELSLEVIQNEWRILNNLNETVMDEMSSFAAERYDEEFLGLSIRQASLKFPQLYLFIQLQLSEVFTDEGEFDSYAPAAVIQGLLKAQNGTEVVVEILTQPEIFSEAVNMLIEFGGFRDCSELDQGYLITVLFTQLTIPLLQVPFQDLLADFLVGLTIDIGQKYQVEEEIVEVLNPMVETLQLTADAEGVLSSLFAIAQQDVVSSAFEEVMNNLNFITNATAWAGLMSGYFQQVQQYLDADDADFVILLTNIFENIIQALQ